MMDKDIINYRCKDCGYEFEEQSNKDSKCPECSSTLLDDLAIMAGIYLLGDWLDLWGDDED